MLTQPYFLHALSPLHVGTGQSVEAIDLPIARMRSTGIPFVPGSSVKGVIRWERKEQLLQDEWTAVFGPDKQNAEEHAGAVVFGDARLLALPVRSLKGVFAWVTSPLLLVLAKRDLDGVSGVPTNVPSIKQYAAKVASVQSHVNIHQRKVDPEDRKVYLEDLDLPASEDSWSDDRIIHGPGPIHRAIFGAPEAESDMNMRRELAERDPSLT